MRARRIWAVARKEGIHIVRDWRSLVMGIAIPILLLILFGYALTLDVDQVPLVVWDQSGTQASRDFPRPFEGSPYFALRRFVRRTPARSPPSRGRGRRPGVRHRFPSRR